MINPGEIIILGEHERLEFIPPALVAPDYSLDAYRKFLERKIRFDHACGFEIDLAEVNPILKPHQRDCVVWAVRGGRRALFEKFGLGKTMQQLEILRLVLKYSGGGRGLIIAPLGVRQEFKRDAEKLGLTITFIRRIEEATADGLYITNYESVRDGKLDPNEFTAVSLDEASVLRSFGSKTYQTFLSLFGAVKFRFVATATPSPNRYKELIHYAGFLGIMDTGQALTRFFQRDPSKAGNLTLYPHKQTEFWLWLNSWAIFLQTPGDLGYSDEGYDLPPLKVTYHEIKVSHDDAGEDRDGQKKMFKNAGAGLREAAREKRDTMPARIAKMMEILRADPDSHYLLWHDLEDERHSIEESLPAATYHHWHEYRDGHPAGIALYERHYSAYQYADGRERKLFCGPGEKLVLLTAKHDALFVWRKFKDDSGQEGINCAVFRNEGEVLSSVLIKEAMAIAWKRWPDHRLYTYVNGGKIESTNPGYCFIMAGWQVCGETKGGLTILEALPGAEVPVVARRVGLRSVFGTQDLEVREQNVIDFSDGRIQYLATKPELSGSGCNFQRHCHKAVFIGVGYKFNDFIQSCHRIYRYLQQHEVEIHIIYADSERDVLDSLQKKWAQHDAMVAEMSKIIREHGLNTLSMASALTRTIGVERQETSGRGWTVVRNDCTDETHRMGTESQDMILTSIPFANHYEYTPSYNDFGHTDGNTHFWAQMDFLIPQLFRVLKPGRIAAIHVKDRILFGSVTGLGFPTCDNFHEETSLHFQKHGFAKMGMITVTTDVVRENNQTYRLGWTENCKDSSRMGVGCSEYVLLFRKPQTDRSRGYADMPVEKSKDEYTRARWQVDAHAHWRSSGNRLLTANELAQLNPDALVKAFGEYSLRNVYDYLEHVRIGEELERRGVLPAKFMAIMPASPDPTVWTDVNRMRTLNAEQYNDGREKHVCPLQFDIIDRLIVRYTNPGERVYDPFGGLFTTVCRALMLDREGYAAELNESYFRDGRGHVMSTEEKKSIPDMFEMLEVERIAAGEKAA